MSVFGAPNAHLETTVLHSPNLGKFLTFVPFVKISGGLAKCLSQNIGKSSTIPKHILDFLYTLLLFKIRAGSKIEAKFRIF